MTWLVVSVIGFLSCLAFVFDRIAALRVANREGFTLQRPELRGQILGGLCIAGYTLLSIWLGWLAVSENRLIREVFVNVLSLGNVLIVLGMVIMTVSNHIAPSGVMGERDEPSLD